MRGKRILVTGGAGFIGSHLVDYLIQENEVVVLDNLSGGKYEFLKHHEGKENFTFVLGDLLRTEDIETALEGVDVVFHLAANPDVRRGAEDTRVHLEQNLIATYNLLEAMRRKDVRDIVFTSTSTVYGEAEVIPTPEDYGPLIPISLYGASKLGAEAYISAYTHLFGMRGVSYRFANIVGPRGTHGVIYDFIRKLKANPRELEILGDGTQTKSYLYVTDCVEAMVFGYEHMKRDYEVFNIGSEDWVNVKRIAEIVVEEMGLSDVKFRFTGGVDGRGWKGDVKVMRLSIEKLKALGWKPRHGSEESVRLTARALIREMAGERYQSSNSPMAL